MKWIVAWLTIASTEPAGFTATCTDEQFVMLSDVANPQGFFGRITFCDKEQWMDVDRILGKRKPK